MSDHVDAFRSTVQLPRRDAGRGHRRDLHHRPGVFVPADDASPAGENRRVCLAARRISLRSASPWRSTINFTGSYHRSPRSRASTTPTEPDRPARCGSLLETLQLPDLSELKDPQSPVPPRPGQVPAEIRVPGFFCSSDPNATAGWFTAPISYRAATGGTPAGDDGPFAIGRVIRLQDIESGRRLELYGRLLRTAGGRSSTGSPRPVQLSGRSRPALERPVARPPTDQVTGAATRAQPGPGLTTAIPSTITHSR